MNSSLSFKIGQIVSMTGFKLFCSFVLALVVFLIEYSPVLIHYLEKSSELTTGVTGTKVSEYVLKFLRYLSNLPHAGDIITILFWMVAGTILYTALSAFTKLLRAIRSEIITDINYSKGRVVRVLFTRFSAKILAVCGFVLLFSGSILWLIPFWMSLLSKFVYSGLQLRYAVLLVIGYLGLSLTIYIVWISAYFTWFYEENL